MIIAFHSIAMLIRPCNEPDSKARHQFQEAHTVQAAAGRVLQDAQVCKECSKALLDKQSLLHARVDLAISSPVQMMGGPSSSADSYGFPVGHVEINQQQNNITSLMTM